jgi:hypothetical protein
MGVKLHYKVHPRVLKIQDTRCKCNAKIQTLERL